MKLYMFRTVPLSVVRSSSLYTQQWFMSYRFADSLRAGSGCSVLILLTSCQQTCMKYTIAVCEVKNFWWWTAELYETCRVLFQNKIVKSVHLFGFVISNYTDSLYWETTPVCHISAAYSGRSFVGRGRADRPDHNQQHCSHHAPKVKPEAVTAIVELLMMGVRTPETCWAANKQVINLIFMDPCIVVWLSRNNKQDATL